MRNSVRRKEGGSGSFTEKQCLGLGIRRLGMTRLFLLVLILCTASLPWVQAVKRHDFKTCQQSGFCKRRRELADRQEEAGSQWKSPYRVTQATYNHSTLHTVLRNQLFPLIEFKLEVRVLEGGGARVVMDEVNGLRQRYSQAASWALTHEPALAPSDSVEADLQPTHSRLSFGGGGAGEGNKGKGRGKDHLKVVVTHDPVSVTFFRDGVAHVVLNGRGLLDMEHFRIKSVGQDSETGVAPSEEEEGGEKGSKEDEDFKGWPRSEEGMWEETFAGKTDSKPKGPESLSLDITFPGYAHVYGIPEHASPLSLKTTRGGPHAYTDPYRLYNLDVFEYEPDSEMALYGAVPLMQAHRAGSTVGVFLASGSEMWIDVTRSPTAKTTHDAFKKASRGQSLPDTGPATHSTSTHWMAESGVLDLFVFLGPTPNDLTRDYTALTGRTPLPALFATAYHQCRWNYLNIEDVLEVQSRFDEADIPLDVIWLDIEYAEEHKYFVWDRRHFPDPKRMQAELEARGRKLVTIIDPHIKRDVSHYIYQEAQQLDILQKMPDGKTEFEGWCWTGSSVWPDWFHPKSWEWWISQFSFDKFKDSSKNLFIWNDMNEPSIFNGPEITLQKDAVHYGGWEHRDVHNIGGMIYHNLTAQGLLRREDPPKRPFVLTRAFFAGSQKFGAMWTGDNLGTWAHLAGTVPMLLSNGIAGMTFAGADVGGFFGNPSPEMMVRWYQVGQFMPFFRAHGHIDTRRREPYLFDQPYQSYLRDAIRLRYQLLPMIYTAFHESSLTGQPLLLPQFVLFPLDSEGFAIDDQFYWARSGLLIKPIVEEKAVSTEVYLSDQQPYYHYLTHVLYWGSAKGGARVTVPAPLDSTPILQRGGSILPRRETVRRSSTLMGRDPITLVIALDQSGSFAQGTLYLDDGESYDYERGDSLWRQFTLQPEVDQAEGLVLKNRPLVWDEASGQAVESDSGRESSSLSAEHSWLKTMQDVAVEKIVIVGLNNRPSCIRPRGDTLTGLEFEWTPGKSATSSRRHSGKPASLLVIPAAAGLPLQKEWDLLFDFHATPCLTNPPVDRASLLPSSSEGCPVGHFRCENRGHLPACLLLSRFNDGICDPECCDGSDERDGKVTCENRCLTVGAEYKKKKDEEERKRRVGNSIRKDYIRFGSQERQRLENEKKKLEEKVIELKEQERRARERLEGLEKREAGELERRKKSRLYTRLVDLQHALSRLQTERNQVRDQVNHLQSILSDLSRDFNPNYQDMAVLGASRAFTEWKRANGLQDEDEILQDGQEDPEPDKTVTPLEILPDQEIQSLIEEDPLSLIDSLFMSVDQPLLFQPSIFNIEDYLPDSVKPSYEGMKQSILEWLDRFGILHLPSPPSSDRPELTQAKATTTQISTDREKAESALQQISHSLERDWGLLWEWKKLEGVCIEKDTGEYTYSLCFFGEATQKSNSNQAKTNLGTFSSWSPTSEKGSQDSYQKQVYSNGQRCWNGPDRSVHVDLVCEAQNRLLSVIEPQKCEYLFKVSTPAVCFDSTSVVTRDEL